MIFLFDIDGTLTPPRKKIEKEFELFFGQWVGDQKSKLNKVFLVTGSDRKKNKVSTYNSSFKAGRWCLSELW